MVRLRCRSVPTFGGCVFARLDTTAAAGAQADCSCGSGQRAVGFVRTRARGVAAGEWAVGWGEDGGGDGCGGGGGGGGVETTGGGELEVARSKEQPDARTGQLWSTFPSESLTGFKLPSARGRQPRTAQQHRQILITAILTAGRLHQCLIATHLAVAPHSLPPLFATGLSYRLTCAHSSSSNVAWHMPPAPAPACSSHQSWNPC